MVNDLASLGREWNKSDCTTKYRGGVCHPPEFTFPYETCNRHLTKSLFFLIVNRFFALLYFRSLLWVASQALPTNCSWCPLVKRLMILSGLSACDCTIETAARNSSTAIPNSSCSTSSVSPVISAATAPFNVREEL